MRNTFITALRKNEGLFGLNLSEEHIEQLARYYEFVRLHNSILHLVASMDAEAFAVRHVLESLTLAIQLPAGECFADVGAGAGLPSIPCLIFREDLSAVLVEAGAKKSRFLSEAVDVLGLSERASVKNKQFQELPPLGFDSVTCRALDKFTLKLPRLLKWAKGKDLYFFGGPNLEEALITNGIRVVRQLMPLSEQRYLFVLRSAQDEGTASRSRTAALNDTPASPA